MGPAVNVTLHLKTDYSITELMEEIEEEGENRLEYLIQGRNFNCPFISSLHYHFRNKKALVHPSYPWYELKEEDIVVAVSKKNMNPEVPLLVLCRGTYAVFDRTYAGDDLMPYLDCVAFDCPEVECFLTKNEVVFYFPPFSLNQ